VTWNTNITKSWKEYRFRQQAPPLSVAYRPVVAVSVVKTPAPPA